MTTGTVEDEEFRFSIREVFTIAGRGSIAVGTVESGLLTTGDLVEVHDNGEVVLTAKPWIEIVCRRPPDSRFALLFNSPDVDLLRPGQIVRRAGQD